MAWYSLGDLQFKQEGPLQALDQMQRAYQYCTQIKYLLGSAQCLQILGQIYQEQGELHQGSDAILEACRLFNEMGCDNDAKQCQAVMISMGPSS